MKNHTLYSFVGLLAVVAALSAVAALGWLVGQLLLHLDIYPLLQRCFDDQARDCGLVSAPASLGECFAAGCVTIMVVVAAYVAIGGLIQIMAAGWRGLGTSIGTPIVNWWLARMQGSKRRALSGFKAKPEGNS
ncbi:hypothetical protein ACQHIH_21885 (plasmid) [Xanthomonas sontii]|uniref:hypothetical protein n=1 Tax=Xanthomonas sontii TaxID=2650745 RepID=UPI003F84AF3A